MKKLLSWVLTLALCLSLLPMTARADDEPLASGNLNGTATYEISADGVLTIHEGTIEGFGSAENWPWYGQGEKITQVVFDGEVKASGSLCGMFAGNRLFPYSSIVSITGLEKLDTSQVTSMKEMFVRCYRLTSLDLSGFDTSNVTDMSEMFGSCGNLTSLDVSGFDTSRVTNMTLMLMCLKEATPD